jgi:hypothetical protein
LVVRIAGPRSGGYLPRFHAGRWRFGGVPGAPELFLRFLQLGFEVADDAWTTPAFQPTPADKTARVAQPARDFDADGFLHADCTTESLPITSDEYFSRIEEVLFEPMVRLAGAED